MPNFFNRKQLAQTNTPEEQSSIIGILQKNNIEYIANSESVSGKTHYTVYVNKNDLEKALCLIGR